MQINEAVKELRKALGDSQQAFSNRLGAGMATVQRWEAGAFKPGAIALVQLYQLARELGRTDLSGIFAVSNRDRLGTGPQGTTLPDYLTEVLMSDLRSYFSRAQSDLLKVMHRDDATGPVRKEIGKIIEKLIEGQNFLDEIRHHARPATD